MMFESILEKDINDAFDDILFFEENAINEAFEEGFQIGVLQGNKDGYHLGFHRGAEIGAEIGFYTGVTEKYLEFMADGKTDSKLLPSLENLYKLLLEFPKTNSADVDVFKLLSKIRTQFKKLSAQMKVNILFPEKSNLSF